MNSSTDTAEASTPASQTAESNPAPVLEVVDLKKHFPV